MPLACCSRTVECATGTLRRRNRCGHASYTSSAAAASLTVANANDVKLVSPSK